MPAGIFQKGHGFGLVIRHAEGAHGAEAQRLGRFAGGAPNIFKAPARGGQKGRGEVAGGYHHHAIALGGVAVQIGVVAGHPNLRQFARGAGRDVGLRQGIIFAFVGKGLARKGLFHHAHHFQKPMRRFRQGRIEAFKLIRLVAAANAKHQAPMRHGIDHADFGNQAGRVVKRHNHNAGSEFDA